MWIKTQGGYLLNLDRVDYVYCDGGYTKAQRVDSTALHIISEGNCLDDIANGLNRRYDYMEVR